MTVLINRNALIVTIGSGVNIVLEDLVASNPGTYSTIVFSIQSTAIVGDLSGAGAIVTGTFVDSKYDNTDFVIDNYGDVQGIRGSTETFPGGIIGTGVGGSAILIQRDNFTINNHTGAYLRGGGGKGGTGGQGGNGEYKTNYSPWEWRRDPREYNWRNPTANGAHELIIYWNNDHDDNQDWVHKKTNAYAGYSIDIWPNGAGVSWGYGRGVEKANSGGDIRYSIRRFTMGISGGGNGGSGGAGQGYLTGQSAIQNGAFGGDNAGRGGNGGTGGNWGTQGNPGIVGNSGNKVITTGTNAGSAGSSGSLGGYYIVDTGVHTPIFNDLGGTVEGRINF